MIPWTVSGLVKLHLYECTFVGRLLHAQNSEGLRNISKTFHCKCIALLAGRDEGIKRFSNPLRQYLQLLPVSIVFQFSPAFAHLPNSTQRTFKVLWKAALKILGLVAAVGEEGRGRFQDVPKDDGRPAQ